jgi:hypothetical protein
MAAGAGMLAAGADVHATKPAAAMKQNESLDYGHVPRGFGHAHHTQFVPMGILPAVFGPSSRWILCDPDVICPPRLPNYPNLIQSMLTIMSGRIRKGPVAEKGTLVNAWRNAAPIPFAAQDVAMILDWLICQNVRHWAQPPNDAALWAWIRAPASGCYILNIPVHPPRTSVVVVVEITVIIVIIYNVGNDVANDIAVIRIRLQQRWRHRVRNSLSSIVGSRRPWSHSPPQAMTHPEGAITDHAWLNQTSYS